MRKLRKAGMALSLAVLAICLSAITPYFYEQERAAWTIREMKKTYEKIGRAHV